MFSASTPSREKLAIIAEDDPFIASMLELLLQEHGVEVRVARDGEEAMQLLAVQLPHLLLLDLLMPRADGYQVLAYIRDQGHVFPIVVITNMSLEDDKVVPLGVSDILIKSNLDEEEIWRRIGQFFESPTEERVRSIF